MNKLKNKYKSLKSRTRDWFYDHQNAKFLADNFLGLLLCVLSASVFAFGFNCFIDIEGIDVVVDGVHVTSDRIVSGGISGISQTFAVFLEVINVHMPDQHLIISILFFVLNIPFLLLAFFGIGKRYGIFSVINVILVSLSIKYLSGAYAPIIRSIAQTMFKGGLLPRVIFGGVCTGLSSAIAFSGDFSAGGVDVLAHYIAIKKKTLVGKYSAIINVVTLLVYSGLLSIKLGVGEPDGMASVVIRAFYSIAYMLVVSLVIDQINVRNKKYKIEVITSNQEMGQFIISSIPHGSTMVKGTGVYSGAERYIFTFVISSYEVKSLLKLVKAEDENAFVQVIPLSAVQGKFFIKPIE